MSRSRRFSPSRGLQRVTRRMSLEWKLPLLMSVVLAIVLTIALAATHATLRSYALFRVQDRLTRATRQIASVAGSGVATAHARYLAIANDSMVRAALRGEVSDSARRLLRRLSPASDSGLPIELWTARGERVIQAGRGLQTATDMDRGRPELPTQIRNAFGAPPRTGNDSLRLGPLYAAPDDGGVRYWLVMPVMDRGRAIGYITHQRRLTRNAQTQSTLRELSGDSVSLFYRNAGGIFWATSDGHATSALHAVDTAASSALTPEGDALLYKEARVGSTPLMVGMSVPYRTVIAAPQRSMRNLLAIGAALFLFGVLAAWLIGRSITRPLRELTSAAGSVAAGRYDARVPETGDLEIRRLAESFNHMAGEIGASRSALETQTRNAEAANSAKSEFLTTMSHELRTPLNAIGGYVELLEMELRGPVTEEQRRDLRRIKTSQQHLLGLISSVLDLARIEAGRVAYDMVNIPIDDFIAELDALVAPQAAAKQVTIEHVPAVEGLTVLADREKLRQVLLNLLSNAIRHTPPGGTITLEAVPRGSRVEIAVADTGPGIAPDRRDDVFEPFVQLDRSLAQSRDGLGLGLAISRDLARGMHGDLVVDDHAGIGARFILTLPFGDAGREVAVLHSGEMPARASKS